MPDWTAPFHRPHMTTEKFEKQKAEYVAKYGYSVTLPGLSDIFHLGVERPLTEEEVKHWKRGDTSFFSPQRYEDVKKMKQKRKDKYLAMLGSPTPHAARTAGSILTAIDDAQDALTTLHVIGRMTMRLAPRILGPIFGGPVGWIMTAADCLNMVQHIGRMGTLPMVGKRNKELATAGNPFSKKGKVKRAIRLIKKFPSKGEIIEVLQTTDQIFGVGICLGPIVGAIQDVFWGGIRMLTGEKVSLFSQPAPVAPWTATAQKCSKAVTHYLGTGPMTSDDEIMAVMMAHYFSQQELLVGQADWNPLDQVIDVEKTEVLAPMPTNVLTLEVIEEEGIPLKDVVGWPHNNKPWAANIDIVNEYDSVATAFLRSIMDKHKHDWLGYAFGNLATEAAFNNMANIEGEDAISYDYTMQSKFASIMLENGLVLSQEQPEKNIQRLIAWITGLEKTGTKPTLKSIVAFTDQWKIKLEKV